MFKHIGHLLFCGYVRILESIEDFRTLHSDPPSQRYALLRFKKDGRILDIFKNILWHFDTPFTFLDVGAEIGYYSIAASKWARTRATIYSFEPNACCFDILMLNAKKHPGIRPQEVALYDHNEPANAMPVITGDAFIEEQALEHVDIIKINTAAASLETLKGFSNTFDATSRIILILECNSQNLKAAGHSVRDLYETLIGMGLEIHSVDSDIEKTKVVLLKDAEHLAELNASHLIGFKGYTKKEIFTLLGCTRPETED